MLHILWGLRYNIACSYILCTVSASQLAMLAQVMVHWKVGGPKSTVFNSVGAMAPLAPPVPTPLSCIVYRVTWLQLISFLGVFTLTELYVDSGWAVYWVTLFWEALNLLNGIYVTLFSTLLSSKANQLNHQIFRHYCDIMCR